MAKGKKKQQTNGVALEDRAVKDRAVETVAAAAPTAPDVPVVAARADTAPTGGPTAVGRPAPVGEPHGVVDSAVAAVAEVARFVNSVVPPRLPAYLGGAALLVLGLVDPPLVLGGALAYEAIRRWGPAPRA